MARGKNRLTDKQVRAIKPGQILNDGGGLLLIASKDAGDDGKPVACYWQYRYWTSGADHRMGLGSLANVSLAAARKKRDQQAEVRDAGNDPIKTRKQAQRAVAEQARAEKVALQVPKDRQLEAVIDRHHAKHVVEDAEITNAKHIKQWRSSLQEVIDTLGADRDVTTIHDTDLFAAVEPIARRAPETAARVVQRLDDIYGQLLVSKVVSVNPVTPLRTKAGQRKLGLPKRGKGVKQKHFRALPYRQAPTFVAALQERMKYLAETLQSLTAARAMLFALLTGSRTKEVLEMPWSEIDMEARTWFVPGNRMKGKQDHVVYLSDAAMGVLKAMKESGPASKWVFPSPRKEGAHLSNMALLMVVRRIKTGETNEKGVPVTYEAHTTPHGFRSTLSTWANEQTNYKSDIIEVALAHSEEDRVRAAYNRQERDTFAAERRRLLQDWASYVMSKSPKAKVRKTAKETAQRTTGSRK